MSKHNHDPMTPMQAVLGSLAMIIGTMFFIGYAATEYPNVQEFLDHKVPEVIAFWR